MTRRDDRLIAEIRAANLTYCGFPKLENIAEALRAVRRRRLRGLFVEAGVALGGSAILIARRKPRRARLKLFDVFGQIPPPSDADSTDAHERFAVIAAGQSEGLGGDEYYGYLGDLQPVVRDNLARFGIDLGRRSVELVPGLYEDALHIAEPVAFAHIDCDWYDSISVCIERIAPHVVRGGILVFDDYGSYGGARRAIDEFLASSAEFKLTKEARSAVVERVG